MCILSLLSSVQTGMCPVNEVGRLTCCGSWWFAHACRLVWVPSDVRHGATASPSGGSQVRLLHARAYQCSKYRPGRFYTFISMRGATATHSLCFGTPAALPRVQWRVGFLLSITHIVRHYAYHSMCTHLGLLAETKIVKPPLLLVRDSLRIP